TVSVGMDAWAAKYARPCDEYGAAVICTTPISRPPWIVPNESRLSMKALNRVVNVAGGVTSVPALALVSRIAPDTSLLPIHTVTRSEEHTSELQSRGHLVCRLLLEKKLMIPNQPETVLETSACDVRTGKA